MNLPIEIVTAIKGKGEKEMHPQLKNNLETPNTVEKEEPKTPKTETKEESFILVLENVIDSYKDINNQIKNHKESIKEKRLEAKELQEKKIHLQQLLTINTLPNKNIASDDSETILNEAKENNTSTKEGTCRFLINKVEKIKENIPSNINKSWEHIKPLENSVKLLKTQIKYTKKLEEILALFNKINKAEEKIKEANEIISMLSEQLK